MIHQLLHILGVDDPSGRWYLWWSGPGADLSYLAAPIVLYRRANCHVRGCWRLGHHDLTGTPWRVCRRHHGTPRPTRATVHAGGEG